jgi:hypothetical protein
MPALSVCFPAHSRSNESFRVTRSKTEQHPGAEVAAVPAGAGDQLGRHPADRVFRRCGPDGDHPATPVRVIEADEDCGG